MPVTPCTTTTITRGVVTFDPVLFKEAYPEFATISNLVLIANFGLAQLMLSNSCSSIVQNAPTRETLLNLLVAHITTLRNGANGQPPAGVVGRINSATQGSVSVAADLPISPNAAWFAQTQWGLLFWQSTAQYRTFRYVPAPCQPCQSATGTACSCGTAGCVGGC